MNVQKVKLVYAKLEERVSQRTGKPYVTCGIKIEGEDFYRNSGEYIGVGDKDKYTHLQAGAEVNLVLYSEPYNGQDQPKFRVPKAEDLMEIRIAALENAVRAINARLSGAAVKSVSGVVGTNTPMVATQPSVVGAIATMTPIQPVVPAPVVPLVDQAVVDYDTAVDMFSDNLASHPDL